VVEILAGAEAGELAEFFEAEDEGVAVDVEGFGGEGDVEVVGEQLPDGGVDVVFGDEFFGEFCPQGGKGDAGVGAARVFKQVGGEEVEVVDGRQASLFLAVLEKEEGFAVGVVELEGGGYEAADSEADGGPLAVGVEEPDEAVAPFADGGGGGAGGEVF
jgi:hypothetical protein